MFNVRYIYSACIVVQTDAAKILCDPWFTDGIYDGSWFQFPKLMNPLEAIGDVDFIYISHIHPDHYDPTFLRTYFGKYGVKRILIPSFKSNFLKLKMLADGFSPEPIDELSVNGTKYRIFPNVTDSLSDIDSALLVSQDSVAFLNLNDCVWSDGHSKLIKECLNNNKLDLRLMALGFAGAGPYPQTYYDDEENLGRLALKKKQDFLDRYLRYCNFFGAKVHLPFAGKYMLGGKLASLNQFRGVSDPAEVLVIDPDAMVLADGGEAFFDLLELKPSSQRTQIYSDASVMARMAEISGALMKYEEDFKFKASDVNFKKLLSISYARAVQRSELNEDYFFVVNVLDAKDSTILKFLMNAKRGSQHFEQWVETGEKMPEPRSEIHIDYRYLFGLLTSFYHWNNAEVGSQFKTRRFPDQFNRSAQRFLNFLSIC